MKRVAIGAAVLVLGMCVSEVSACGFRGAGRVSVSKALKTTTASTSTGTGGSVILLGDAGDPGLEASLKRANFKVARATDAVTAQNALSGDKNRLILAPLTEAEALRGLGVTVIPVVTTANAGAAISKGFSTVVVKESSADQKLDAIRKSMPAAVAIP